MPAGSHQTAVAPKNPFQKTLATMQGTSSQEKDIGGTQSSRPTIGDSIKSAKTRPSLDVDSFKRLLMTGNANAPKHGTPATSHLHPGSAQQGAIGDSSSNTDSSSISRQSIFEPMPEATPDSPRTSHEIFASDDERLRLVRSISSGSNKIKPAPPKTRHGKPIRSNTPQTVSFSDPSLSWSSFEKPMPAKPSRPESAVFVKTPTDINKPLPPAPAPAPAPSPPQSQHDNALSPSGTKMQTTESSISSATQSRKPPAPPSRRQSYLKSSQSPISRSDSRSILTEAGESSSGEVLALSSSSSKLAAQGPKAPPPPPSRRPGGGHARTMSDYPSSPATPLSTVSTGGTRPIRSSSGSKPHGPAPPPVPPSRTQSSSSRRARGSSVSSSSSAAPFPPQPPPRRGSARSSLDTSIPMTASPPSELIQDTDQVSERRQSVASLDKTAKAESKRDSGDIDILADLTALQREVDELRGRYASRSASG
ncbi:hypothetical protein L228DRAFT_248532 [Xylona heveae TC161]|uniref:Uncharacterized protein n=1 Tax=Xylona heveae (strain CBS 132557 / TC161) TaxID=1328760 RepID=A0A165G660_XYLHT|nr:hypothetical protein L228DRAFT_248532 [Xylona heveae TC161]KZF21784.1 hypothetical protein L228DRAFT_248532 [Xylona heveae TC161]